MQYLHMPLSRLFFNQSAWNYGSMPKMKFSDHLISTFRHYEEASFHFSLPGWANSSVLETDSILIASSSAFSVQRSPSPPRFLAIPRLQLYLSFLSLLWLEGTWGVLKKDWQQDMQVSKQLDQEEGSCCWTLHKIQQRGHYSGSGLSLLPGMDQVCRWSQRQGQSRWSWSCRNHSRWWPNWCHQERTCCRHWTCRFRRQTWRKAKFQN